MIDDHELDASPPIVHGLVRGSAAELGFDPPPTLDAQGFDAIETRVARSYERFVEKQEFSFRACPGAIRLNGVVRIGWEVVSIATGDVVGGGSGILVLDDNGRINAGYMFPGSCATAVLVLAPAAAERASAVAGSAGRNAPGFSSASVTSTAVAKVVTVVIRRSPP